MSGEIYRLTCHVVPMGVTRLSGVPATPRRVYGSAIVLLSGTHLLLPPGFQCFPFIADFRFHVGLNSSDLREHFCWKVRLWLCNSLSRSRGGPTRPLKESLRKWDWLFGCAPGGIYHTLPGIHDGADLIQCLAVVPWHP